MSDPSYCQGRTALVTGGASGIGQAICNELVYRGARVIVADIDESGAKAVATSLTAGHSDKAIPVALDVRDAKRFDEIVGQGFGDEHGIDFLFNNAGIGVGGDVKELSVEHWQRVIDVNLLGVVNGITAAYPRMVERRSGHIINTASLAGLIPAPLLTPYAATKHAVVGLSNSLRAEAAPNGVRVSVVCPGVIETPLLDSGTPEDLPKVSSFTPGQARSMLTRLTNGKTYPAQSLARTVLDNLASNRALIVAPLHARFMWRVYRAFPERVVQVLPIVSRWTLNR